MPKTPTTTAGKNLELYEKLIATNPKVARKGAKIPNTSLNGHMFSFLTPSGSLALRLPAEEMPGFLKKYKTTLCQAYGVAQKEYAMAPDALLAKTPELKKYFDASYAYVSSLKPKPSAKKKAK